MRFPFPFLTIFLILIAALTYRLYKIRQSQGQPLEDFWEKERLADLAPAKDLSLLTYITIPLEKFPLEFSDDPEVDMIEQELAALSKKRLLNLNGKTNTDLKLEYGARNLEAMQEIGDDFSRMTILLTDYAKALMQEGRFSDAATVLEFGLAVRSDISTNYTLLGDCYQATGQTDKIRSLKEEVKSLHLLLETKILTYLDQLGSEENFLVS